MCFYQSAHTQLVGLAQVLGQLSRAEQTANQQHCVRSQALGLVNLVLVDGEVLAQDGQLYSFPYLAQVLVTALEELGLRQAGDGGGAALCVLMRLGQVDALEVRGDEPLGGRGLLSFCNYT